MNSEYEFLRIKTHDASKHTLRCSSTCILRAYRAAVSQKLEHRTKRYQSELHSCDVQAYYFCIMAPRFQRFVDSSGKILTDVNVASIAEKMEADFNSFESIMEEERKSSLPYGEAWAAAEELYEAKIKASLPPKYAKVIEKEMPQKLPPSLKNTPSFVPIAVLVITQEELQEFVTEFNEATQSMIESSDWSSFQFKSLFMLLNLAQRHLISRPNQDLKKAIFRSVSSEWDLEKDQLVNLGYYASFTPKRWLAMGVQGEEEDAGDDAADSESPVAALRPTLIKIEFSHSVAGLGVKLLSPLSDDEREAIISPLQNFKVDEVLHRKKKGFKIYKLVPADQ